MLHSCVNDLGLHTSFRFLNYILQFLFYKKNNYFNFNIIVYGFYYTFQTTCLHDNKTLYMSLIHIIISNNFSFCNAVTKYFYQPSSCVPYFYFLQSYFHYYMYSWIILTFLFINIMFSITVNLILNNQESTVTIINILLPTMG